MFGIFSLSHNEFMCPQLDVKTFIGKCRRLKQKDSGIKEKMPAFRSHDCGIIGGVARNKPNPLRMNYKETVHNYSFSLTNSPTSVAFPISEK